MTTIINSILFTFSFLGFYKFLENRFLKSKSSVNIEKLLIKFNDKNAKLPYKASAEAAGLDLYSCESGIIPPHSKKLINIGISLEIPFGYYGRIAPRSGLTVKSSIDVGAGVIDSDYRGNISVILFNHGDEKFTFNQGDKIAQLIIEKIAIINTVYVNNLNHTERGDKGFGSTGVSNFNIGLNYNGDKEENTFEESSEEECAEKEGFEDKQSSEEESFEDK